MKKFIPVISVLFLIPAAFARAHEGEAGAAEITEVAAADWVGPLVAVLIIAASIVLARSIKKLK